MAHLVVVLFNVGWIGLNPRLVSAPIPKADRVGSQDRDPAPGQRRTKCLEWVAGQPGYLALPKMPLAMVLMMDRRGGNWAVSVRQEEMGRNRIAIAAGKSNGHPAVTLLNLCVQRIERHRRVGQAEAQEITNLLTQTVYVHGSCRPREAPSTSPVCLKASHQNRSANTA